MCHLLCYLYFQLFLLILNPTRHLTVPYNFIHRLAKSCQNTDTFEQMSMFKLSQMGEKNFTFQYWRHTLQRKKKYSMEHGAKFSNMNGGNRPTAAFGISVLLHIEVYFFYFFKINYNQLAFHTSHMTHFHHLRIYQMSTTKEQNVSFSKVYGITQAFLFKYHYFGLRLQQRLECF